MECADHEMDIKLLSFIFIQLTSCKTKTLVVQILAYRMFTNKNSIWEQSESDIISPERKDVQDDNFKNWYDTWDADWWEIQSLLFISLEFINHQPFAIILGSNGLWRCLEGS